MNKFLIASIAGVASMITTATYAHPSPNILQAGGNKGERTALHGVVYTTEKNVGVYRGRRALAGDTPVTPHKKMRREIRIELTAHHYRPRQFRGLRTHGFYAGDPYKSRRYTQGFYSGN